MHDFPYSEIDMKMHAHLMHILCIFYTCFVHILYMFYTYSVQILFTNLSIFHVQSVHGMFAILCTVHA